MKISPGCLVALTTLGVACSAPTVKISVNLITESCPGGPPPLGGVQFLSFTVAGGDGPAPAPLVTGVGSQQIQLPAIPLGQVTLNVQGLSNSTASAEVLAEGSSGPLQISPSVGAINATILLRRANAFGYTNNASAPGTCTDLLSPRAYHSQTLLPNGQVLIYGGVQLPQTIDWTQMLAIPPMAIPGATYLSSAELYDPQTGQFTAAGGWANSTQAPSARAFAQLLPLDDGNALALGGENAASGIPLAIPAWGSGLFSPNPAPAWSASSSGLAHDRGCLAMDSEGHPLMEGGYSQLSADVDSANIAALTTTSAGEFFDPTYSGSSGALKSQLAPALPADATTTAARADQSCTGFGGLLGVTQNLVVEVGGTHLDPTGQTASILCDFLFYAFSPASGSTPAGFAPYVYNNTLIAGQLLQPRARAKAVAMKVTEQNETELSDAVLITGGISCTPSEPGQSCNPTFASGGSGQLGLPPQNYLYNNDGGTDVATSTELLHFPLINGSPTVTETVGPLMISNRVDHCAVALPDGRAVLIGGLGLDESGNFNTLDTAEVVFNNPPTSQGTSEHLPALTTAEIGPPGLLESRAGMACTLLQDGSILVTGGVHTTGALNGSQQTVSTLQTAEIYYPLPLASQL